MSRDALVWNFEDNNYTWMDAKVDKDVETSPGVFEQQLLPVFCMDYGFDPGWQVKWRDWLSGGKFGEITWEQLQAGSGDPDWEGTRWVDLWDDGTEENLYWLAEASVELSDQTVRVDSLKDYFVLREQLDLNDLVEEWTTNNWKHLRAFYFHLQSPTPADVANSFRFRAGWSINLMDDPTWKAWQTLTLNDTDNAGQHKVNLRATGRYLAIQMDFNLTQELAMTGGDMDAEVAHGR